MAKSARDMLEDKLVDEYDINILIAAVCQLMLNESGKREGNFTKQQITDFMDNLDYDGLLEVQCIADDTEMRGIRYRQ